MVYVAVLGSIALALVLSVVSYGVYSLALGLAMIDASPATRPAARRWRLRLPAC